jgi:hypothetical protein
MGKRIDTSTFFDLLNLVEGRLKELLPQFRGALDQIKSDFKVDESDTYIRMYRSLGDLDDLLGHLDCLRSARASADDVTISLPKDLADRVEVAACDAQYALGNAADVFEGLEYVINNDSANGNGRFVTAVMRLASRALNDIAEKEAADIERVASLIRQEQGARIKSTMAKAA